ncbi:hypothetical protein HYW55_02625 [Candidatus Gottesmanbacteria bacterium]|nr:hypothetical protein [Candidatus Gottesmanbacteria bacterium]
MNVKVTKLSDEQLESFRFYRSSMGSLATLSLPGTYPTELKNCGIKERKLPNQLVGFNVASPSGSQIVIQTVFYDPKDRCDNGDLHVINFESKEIESYYRGWGTWTHHYGNKHWENKDYLRVGSTPITSR